MGKFGVSNPTVDFVIELIKTLNQSELEQVARVLSEQLSRRTVIDISSIKQGSQETPTESSRNSLATMLQTLVGQGGLQNLLGNENNLGKLLSLLKAKDLTPESKPLMENVPVSSSLASSLPSLMQVATQLLNTEGGSHTREEALFEAMAQFVAPHRKEQLMTIQPLIKMMSSIQTMTGNKKISLAKLSKLFRPRIDDES